MDKTALSAALHTDKLLDLTQHIEQITRPSMRLSRTIIDEGTLKVGDSKIGGSPDLPTGVVWPQWQGLPQSFIAQLQLADLHTYDIERLLPETGMLWFFYDAKQETYGEKSSDQGGWQILFRDSKGSAPNSLHRTSAPSALPAESQFKACSLNYANEITIAQQPQLEVPELKWSDELQEQYDQVLTKLTNPTDPPPHHRMLGFADTIQDDMRQQCQLISHGIKDANDPHAKELLKEANEWQLLLQIDTDERIGMRWASSGMLYYWIKRSDLQMRNFDKVWLVLQSE